MTVPLSALLAQAVARLRQAGVADPARDARLLLADAAGLPADRLVLHLGDAADDAVAQRLAAAVDRRAAHQPVSQILGHRTFWGRRFRVTPDVLDPRPETEGLVALALAAPFDRVLDLGTGSGCILISLLADRPGATGLGVDLSDRALAVAAANAADHGVTDRAQFLQSDWWSSVGGRFHLIVSNPPYLAADEIAGLSPDVRDWEPHQALTPGGDGLAAYRSIAAGAMAHLVPSGRLMVEIGPTQGAAVAGLFAGAGLRDIAVHPDLDGRDRIVTARAP